MLISGLEKKSVTQNLREWDGSTNTKFPHLHVHKLKPPMWGTALVIFAEVGDPLYLPYLVNIVHGCPLRSSTTHHNAYPWWHFMRVCQSVVIIEDHDGCHN